MLLYNYDVVNHSQKKVEILKSAKTKVSAPPELPPRDEQSSSSSDAENNNQEQSSI
jgi:hypothetical protein